MKITSWDPLRSELIQRSKRMMWKRKAVGMNFGTLRLSFVEEIEWN